MSPTTTTTVLIATPNSQSKDHNNKNTSTLRKASVETSTSPGVIQPQATVPSVEAEGENIRPPPPGISAEGTGPLNEDRDRDARAYERERQRTKQAEEWAKRRAMKATGQGTIGGKGVGRLAGAGTAHAGRGAKNWKGGRVGLDVDVDVYAVIPQSRDIERTTIKMWDGLGAGLFKRAPLPVNGGGTDASKVQGVIVNLSELVASSQRKPRKLNVDDFEVIPSIRSVIALDDVANVHDMDLEEPWEHIYADDREGRVPDGVGKPSYARVVGTKFQ